MYAIIEQSAETELFVVSLWYYEILPSGDKRVNLYARSDEMNKEKAIKLRDEQNKSLEKRGLLDS